MRLVLLLALLACAPRAAVAPPAVPSVTSSADPLARSWFVRAAAAEARGDLEAAEIGYRWVVRLDPQSPWSWIYLAGFLERERRWAEAEEAWAHAVEQGPRLSAANAGYALARGRAGDAAAEVEYLELALVDEPTPAICERLFDLQHRAAKTDAAAATYRAWQRLPLRDPVERLRRARAARTLGDHASALTDLVPISDTGRAGEVGPMLVESSLAACRLDFALAWARQAVAGTPADRALAASVAERAGDAGLLGKLAGWKGPESTDHALYPAPSLGLPPDALDLRAAQVWLRAREPARALTLLRAADADVRVAPWSLLLQARARVALGETPDLAMPPSADHPAAPAWRALLFETGRTSAGDTAAWLREDPARVRPFVEALADAVVRGPLPPATRVEVHPEPGGVAAVGDRLALPAAELRSYRVAAAWRAAEGAVARGRPSDAAAALRDHLRAVPDDPVGWWALARAEPEQAPTALEQALKADPCFAPAMLARAASAADPDALRWLERARAADPLSGATRRALAQRGMDGL